MKPSIPKTASLRLPQIIALYIGSVLGSGILLLPGITADFAGPASLLAWGCMSLLAFPMALTMGLLSIYYPHAGGVSHFVSRAFNPKVGSLVGWFFLLSAIMAVPIIALTGAGYATVAFGLTESFRLIITVCILITGIGVNYIGMKMTGQIQLAVVIATILILVCAIAGSISYIDPANFTPFMPYGSLSVGYATTLIFWCFLGWEAISHVSEEFENAQRDVVKATIIASVIIGCIYCATAVAVIGTHSYGNGISAVSLIHLISLSSGRSGMFIAGIITLFITTAPVIAYISAASRLAYSLSINGYAPKFLSSLSIRFHTPAGGLIFLLICCIIQLILFSLSIISLKDLVQIPNATFILTYLFGCAAGIVLLKRHRGGVFVSVTSLILTSIIFCFVGWAFLWPVLITGTWFCYMMISQKDRNKKEF